MLRWDGLFPLVLILPLQVCSKQSLIVNIVLILPLQSPWSSVTQGPLILQVLTGYGPWPALSLNSLLKHHSFNTLLQLHAPCFTPSSKITHSLSTSSSHSHFTHFCSFLLTMSSSKDPASISAISPLTSANYCLWADDMKSWLQLNGLWRLVSGQEKKPAPKPEITYHHHPLQYG